MVTWIIFAVQLAHDGRASSIPRLRRGMRQGFRTAMWLRGPLASATGSVRASANSRTRNGRCRPRISIRAGGGFTTAAQETLVADATDPSGFCGSGNAEGRSSLRAVGVPGGRKPDGTDRRPASPEVFLTCSVLAICKVDG